MGMPNPSANAPTKQTARLAPNLSVPDSRSSLTSSQRLTITVQKQTTNGDTTRKATAISWSSCQSEPTATKKNGAASRTTGPTAIATIHQKVSTTQCFTAPKSVSEFA